MERDVEKWPADGLVCVSPHGAGGLPEREWPAGGSLPNSFSDPMHMPPHQQRFGAMKQRAGEAEQGPWKPGGAGREVDGAWETRNSPGRPQDSAEGPLPKAVVLQNRGPSAATCHEF